MLEAATHVTFTIDQVLEMDRKGWLPQDRRVELLGGELLSMPVPGPSHVTIVTRLQSLFAELNRQGRVVTQGHVAIPEYDLPSPDLMILKAPPSGRLITPQDTLLVVEVSDSTLRRDRFEKLPRYLSAGVPEVWIVDVQARACSVYVEPSIRAVRNVSGDEPIRADVLDDWPVITMDALFEWLPR